MHAFHALRRAALAAPLLARALSAPPSSLSLTRSLAPKLLDFGEVHEPTSTRVLETFATPEEIYAAFADAGVDAPRRAENERFRFKIRSLATERARPRGRRSWRRRGSGRPRARAPARRGPRRRPRRP